MPERFQSGIDFALRSLYSELPRDLHERVILPETVRQSQAVSDTSDVIFQKEFSTLDLAKAKLIYHPPAPHVKSTLEINKFDFIEEASCL